MKKCLVVLMVLALAVAFSVAVAAAPSSEGGLLGGSATGVDANGTHVQVKVVKSVSKDISPFEAEFQKIKSKNGSMQMLSHVDVIADGDLSQLVFPLTITVPVAGATPSTKGYFLLKKSGGTVVRLEAVMGNGTATAVFPELGEVVFVSDMSATSEIDIGTPDNSTGTDKAEKTSDNTVPFVAVLMVSALVLGISAKKLSVK